MNEQIKELVKQAVTRFDPDMDGEMEPNEIGDWVMVDDLEKFAELIVKECAQLVLGVPVDSMGYHTADQKIKQHFGVEE